MSKFKENIAIKYFKVESLCVFEVQLQKFHQSRTSRAYRSLTLKPKTLIKSINNITKGL